MKLSTYVGNLFSTIGPFLPRIAARILLKTCSDTVLNEASKSLSVRPVLGQAQGGDFGSASSLAPDVGSRRQEFRLSLDLMARTLPVKRSVSVYWFDDGIVEVPLGTDSSRNCFVLGEYEPLEMYFAGLCLFEGATAIDVGAHDGLYSLLFQELTGPNGTVVAVEPNRLTALAGNVKSSKNAEVTKIVRCALAEEPGREPLLISEEKHSGLSTLGRFVYETEIRATQLVDVITLDKLCEDLELMSIDFVKIDAEGAEAKILQGGLEKIQEHRPSFLIEILPTALSAQGNSSNDVLGPLLSFGYRVFGVDRKRGGLNAENLDEYEYWLAIHPSRGLALESYEL